MREILPELPACPGVYEGMRNEDLLAAWAVCRSAQEVAADRVRVWERWAETEAEAHARLSGQ